MPFKPYDNVVTIAPEIVSPIAPPNPDPGTQLCGFGNKDNVDANNTIDSKKNNPRLKGFLVI